MLINNERRARRASRRTLRAREVGKEGERSDCPALRKRRKGSARRVRDTCKEENEEGPTLTGRWSAMVRPSVFSGNNRKRNICARNATRSLPFSLPPRSPSLLSHLFLFYFILRSLLPVYPPRRRLVSVLPSLPLYWDAKREQCRSLNLFSAPGIARRQ